jgi:peptidase M28-like protein
VTAAGGGGGGRALLAELAVPRLTGTPANARVREILKRELAARGFVVLEQRFAARPRWPLWGVPPRDAVNLIAVRPRARVSCWLVAHHDSKGQPASMATRLALVGGAGVVGVAGAAALAAGAGWGLLALASAAALAALFLLLNRVTDRSPGAVDNAAALVCALLTVDALPATAPVGVIFPDAEELGLQGARALVRERANLLSGTMVINLDGIDDAGTTRVLAHRPGSFGDAVAAALGVRVSRRLPVIVDGIVLSDVADECLTVLRGDWRTARRVHTPRDTAERLTLTGARQVAQGLAAAMTRV